MLDRKVLQYALKRSHFKARQLAGSNGFAPGELDDIRQVLLVDLLERLGRYDPARAGIKTFISRVLDNGAARIIEHHKAQCRDRRRVDGSLDEWTPVDDGSWTTRGAQTTEADASAHVGAHRRPEEELTQLRFDLTAVVDGLPKDLRDLCVRLRTQMVSEVSRETGMSRGAIYRSLQKLRQQFTEAGLHEYMPPDRTGRGQRR